MICVVNFANSVYRPQQVACTTSAYCYGKADNVIEFSEKNLPENFFEVNSEIMNYKRGFGLWLWKPYIILRAMDKLQDGDILVYADSGITFIRDIKNLTPILDSSKDGMAFFECPLLNEDWTKGEAFNLAGYFPTQNERQIMGNFFILKVSDKSKDFIAEWYEMCRNEKLISPKIFDNSINNGNHFIAHREDQSLLSILVRKKKASAYPDPSDYGEFQFQYTNFGRCNYWNKGQRLYPTVILCNRKISSKKYKRNYRIKSFMNRCGLYNYGMMNFKRNFRHLFRLS